MAGDRLVHRIVDDLGGEVVKGAGVGAADVHAGAAADRLEPFEHLDRGRVVAVGRGGAEENRSAIRPCYRARLPAAKFGGGTYPQLAAADVLQHRVEAVAAAAAEAEVEAEEDQDRGGPDAGDGSFQWTIHTATMKLKR